MCSRYTLIPEERAFGDLDRISPGVRRTLLAWPPRPRLAPTDPVPIIVRRRGDEPAVVTARWGFVPRWWNKPELPKLCFNARSEDAAIKPMWRDAFRESRCLVPATSWTEWQKAQGVKVPHTLDPESGRGFLFAGLWSEWQGRDEADALVTCALLTREATPAIRHVHDRMPIVLAPAAWADWLDAALTDPKALRQLLEAHTVTAVRAVTVGSH